MPTLSVGSRATAVTLLQKLDDATVGNKDGIVGNEGKPAGTAAGASVFDKNPLLFKMRAFLEAGASKLDEEARLGSFLDAAEKAWGASVTTHAKPAHVSQQDWNAHLVDKAITLVRLGRKPDDVVDGFVSAQGSVDGHAIAAREVFTQTWKPTAEASGKTIVLSPGFLETGRNYVEQIALLNAQGHEVVVLDHQWAGLSSGPKGGIDRGFGIARDVAAVAASAAQTHGGKNEIIVVGTSMGAGAGALGAVLMNDAGKVALDGPAMPKGVKLVLQGPFFARSGGVVNAALSLGGKIPGVNNIDLPAIGMPILSGDQATLRKMAAHATTEHLTGKLQAFHASDDDLATMKRLLESGVRPQGPVEIIHATHDTLADYETSKQWASLVHAHLTTVESTSHVFEENAAEQGLLLNALKRLGV